MSSSSKRFLPSSGFESVAVMPGTLLTVTVQARIDKKNSQLDVTTCSDTTDSSSSETEDSESTPQPKLEQSPGPRVNNYVSHNKGSSLVGQSDDDDDNSCAIL